MSAQILTVKYNENNVPYIGLGEHEIRLEAEAPSEAVMEKARNELRELPEITGDFFFFFYSTWTSACFALFS